MANPTDTQVREAPPESVSAQAPLPASERDLRWKRFTHRNPKFRMFLVIGAVILVIAGVLVWRYLSSYESTDDAQIDGHLNPVSARVSGHVLKLFVDDNQYVQAGAPLLQIDPTDYQVALERAKARYAEAVAAARTAQVNVPITSVGTSSQISGAQADVLTVKAAVGAAKQQAEATKAELEQAEANNAKAQSDLERYKQLVQKQEISEQQYDQAIAAAKASAASVVAARASLAAAQQQVQQAEGKLEMAQANLRSTSTAPQQVAATRSKAASAEAAVKSAKAELDQAQLNMQYTTITAPVNGVVTGRTVEVGQNVQIGQELMRVINLDDIWVTANFKETQLQDMKVGQPADISVDATGKTYKGHVQSIAGASGAVMSLLPPENATGNYVKVVQRIPVKITFDAGQNQSHELRPGMSAEPKVWVR